MSRLLRHTRLMKAGPSARHLATSALPPTNHWVAKVPNYEALQAENAPGTFRLAVKDNITTGILPTTCASAVLLDHLSPIPATITSQLVSLGGRLLGTTNMDEFGMGAHSTNSVHGAVRHPLESRRDHSAGGSSGGSAVAVALGEADVALGTDTGGSVRVPAAYCGIVGMKPSYGLISRHGVIPYAHSLDTVAFFAREIDILYDILITKGLYNKHDPLDPTSHNEASRQAFSKFYPPPSETADLPLKGISIGLPLEYNITELDPLILQTWLITAETLASQGATIHPISLPTTRHTLAAYFVLAPAEASSNLAKYDGVRYGKRSPAALAESDTVNGPLYSDTRGLLGDEVRRRLLVGAFTLSDAGMQTYFRQAQRVRRWVQRDFDRAFIARNPLHTDPTILTDKDADDGYGDGPGFDLSELDERIQMVDKRGPAQVDFILAPTSPQFPPRIEDVEKMTPAEVYASDVFTVGVSLAGLPAVSVPVPVQGDLAGREKEVEGFTVGMQVIGQFWDDARVLAAGKKVMEVMRR